MSQKNDIQYAQTIKTMQFIGYFFSFIILGTYMSLFIAVRYNITTIAIAGIGVFVLLPFLLMKRILLLFTKRVQIVFNDTCFSITLFGFKSQSEISNRIYDYDDIDYCVINSNTGDYSRIKMVFHKEENIEYVFKDLEGGKNNISEIVYKMIKRRKNTIVLKPTLYASKFGTNIINSLAILIVVLVLIHIKYSLKTLPVTLLISGPLLIRILLKRRDDIETFKELENYKP